MLALCVSLVVAQAVVVVDISAEDAVYEDESRALAIEIVDVLNAAGLTARRIEENELPEKGCHSGPCLKELAKTAQALVAVDVQEIGKEKWSVAVTALASANGMPLAGARYQAAAKMKRPVKELTKFAQKLVSMLRPPGP